jgi:hypothetical protein
MRCATGSPTHGRARVCRRDHPPRYRGIYGDAARARLVRVSERLEAPSRARQLLCRRASLVRGNERPGPARIADPVGSSIARSRSKPRSRATSSARSVVARRRRGRARSRARACGRTRLATRRTARGVALGGEMEREPEISRVMEMRRAVGVGVEDRARRSRARQGAASAVSGAGDSTVGAVTARSSWICRSSAARIASERVTVAGAAGTAGTADSRRSGVHAVASRNENEPAVRPARTLLSLFESCLDHANVFGARTLGAATFVIRDLLAFA